MELEAVQNCTGTVFTTVGALSSVALSICAFVAVAGLIAAPTMGSLYIGLGGGGSLLTAIGAGCGNIFLPKSEEDREANKKKTIYGAIFSAILWCSIGALGVAGVMTGVQLGWVLTGMLVAGIGLGLITSSIACCAYIAAQ